MQVKLCFSVEAKEFTDDISLRIKHAGREACNANKRQTVWAGKNYALHFIREGRGTLKLGDREMHLKAGMCFVLYKGSPIEFCTDRHDPWKYDWINFTGENVDSLLAKCGFSIEEPYRYYPTERYFINELNKFYEFHAENSIQDLCVGAQFVKILGELAYHRNKKEHSFPNASTRFSRVRDCMIYINHNFYSDLNLEGIARANSISVSYMMSIWEKEVGMTPIQYVHAFRISEACRLLKCEMWPVKEIAKKVGYADEKYFMRVFRKYKGMSPTEYRECSKEEDSFSWLKEKNMDFRI